MEDGNYLLDSTIVINLFKNDSKTVNRIKNAKTVYVSSIGLGELYYGAYKSSSSQRHFLEIKNLEKGVPILDCGTGTAKIYGKVKNELKKIGKPIPENDIWIAAIAIENDLILANRDHHFDWIEGLRQEKW